MRELGQYGELFLLFEQGRGGSKDRQCLNSHGCLRACRANQVPALLPNPVQSNGGNASVALTPNPTSQELSFA